MGLNENHIRKLIIEAISEEQHEMNLEYAENANEYIEILEDMLDELSRTFYDGDDDDIEHCMACEQVMTNEDKARYKSIIESYEERLNNIFNVGKLQSRALSTSLRLLFQDGNLCVIDLFNRRIGEGIEAIENEANLTYQNEEELGVLGAVKNMLEYFTSPKYYLPK